MVNGSEQLTHLPDYNMMERGISRVELFLFRKYMSELSRLHVEPYAVSLDKNGNVIDEHAVMRFFRITQLVLDKQENSTDKLASVYGSAHSIGATLMLVVRSTREGIEFYIGVKTDPFSDEFSAATAEKVLRGALKSNFPGTDLEKVKRSGITSLMSNFDEPGLNVSSVAINPSLRDDDKERFVQGLEKLMDAFSGHEYTACFIAVPVGKTGVMMRKLGLEEQYSALSRFAETTVAYGTSETKTVTENISYSFSDSVNNGISNSNGASQSDGVSGGIASGSSGRTFFGGMRSNSEQEGWSRTRGTNWSESITKGTSVSNTDSKGNSIGNATGTNKNITVKHTEKTISRLLEIIDEQLTRISSFESYGMWDCSAYFVSDDVSTSVAAANTFRALVLGDETRTEAFVNTWMEKNPNTPKLLEYVALGRHPVIRVPAVKEFAAQLVKPTSLVSGKELPIFLGFPRFSLKGLIVNRMASFGRAVSSVDLISTNSEDNKDVAINTNQKNSRTIRLGRVMHKGSLEESNIVDLDIDKFTSHCFITGSTGSGKSNATYHILESMLEKNINFLVIEPKKGEYKDEFGKLEGVKIFWTSKDQHSFLRINPFSFPKGIHVLEHMDRLIEIFNACWPMHNAMPAIMKDAMERSYIECGWDLSNSLHFDVGKSKYPKFDDLLIKIGHVIETSGYSADAKGDYKGALETRVTSLTKGIMGQVFSSDSEIENKVLFDHNTIIDLSRVGASETKSLIMGIIIMKLNEYRISSPNKSDSELRHITVIEEAHNLLRRVSMEQNGDRANIAGKSVEMISNSIAEMRTYGEGFLIIDQSPTAVDVSAIKNTNTKIVMRLPERTDIETAGYAFSLQPEQIDEISRLPRGAAIVSQSGWVEPVMVMIDKSKGAHKYHDGQSAPKNLRKHVILPYVRLVLELADNCNPNEKPVKDLLREKNVSPSLYEELFQLFKQFSGHFQAKNIVPNKRERAVFTIDTIGCKALAEVYRFRFDKNWSAEQMQMECLKWRKKIYEALDEYATFNSLNEKWDVVKQLLLVKARIDNSSDYEQILKANPFK